jgi:hypothetical protein
VSYEKCSESFIRKGAYTMTEIRPRGDRSRSQTPEGSGGHFTRVLADAERKRRLSSEGFSSDEEAKRIKWQQGLKGPEKIEWEKEVKRAYEEQKIEDTEPVIKDRKRLNEEFGVLVDVKIAIEDGYKSHIDSLDSFRLDPQKHALYQKMRQFGQGSPLSETEDETIHDLAPNYTTAAEKYIKRCTNHNNKFSEYYDTYDEKDDLKPLDVKEDEENLQLNLTS